LVLAVDPGNSAALNNLGSGCILTGHPEDGIHLFRRAIARNPGSPQCARSAPWGEERDNDRHLTLEEKRKAK
jgi:hypothetical protein